MSLRERMTLAAGWAVVLASTGLLAVFEDRHWVRYALGAVITVVAVGLAARRARVPVVLQPLLTLAGLGCYLSQVFVRGSLRLGVLPTGRTLPAGSALVHRGRADIAQYAPPVPTHPGLLLLCTAGIGAIALAVDVLACLLARPAVAGLPLLALMAVPSAVLHGGLGWFPFVLGAGGWLGLLILEGGERVGQWGSPARTRASRPDDSSLGRVGRRVGLTALGLALVVPTLLPGLDSRLVGGGAGDGTGSGRGSRSTTTFNPITTLGKQLREQAPQRLLTYTTNDPSPDYLRMTTLDEYDGGGWHASTLRADPDRARVQDGIALPPREIGPRQDLAMSVSVDSLNVRWLPLPFDPTRVSVKGSWLWDPQRSTGFSTERATTDLRKPYAVTASRLLPTRDLLRAAPPTVDPSITSVYDAALPTSPYVDQLTAAITQGAATDYDKAAAIQAWFRDPREGFVYDLTPSQATDGGDQLEAFLRGKRGFCEQYATAMAVLLRGAGLPSRVAVGFTPGTRDAGTGRWTVTTRDAHAWPEAFFEGAGWVRFEPTPPQSTAAVPAYSLPPVAGSGPAPDVSVAPRASAAPRPGGHIGVLEGERPAGRAPVAPVVVRRPRSQAPLLAGFIGLGTLLLLAAPAVLSLVRRRRRWAVPVADATWEQVREDAADIGYRWDPTMSPRPAAAGLAAARRLPAPAAAALERVAVAAERARYARPGAVPDPRLRADGVLVRSTLLDGCSSAVRWRARLLPPSTLRWAGSTTGAALADVVERTDVLAAAVRRRARRRPTRVR